jgi:adenylyl-sulfate kinase
MEEIQDQHRLSLPYGGVLVQNFAVGAGGQELLRRIALLPRIAISEREFFDLELIGSGAFSPLTGFMDRETYYAVRDQMTLPSGLPWGWPVTLAIDEAQADRIEAGTEVGLYFRDLPIALMEVSDVYQWHPGDEAIAVFGSENTDNPAIAERIRRGKNRLIGGDITLVVESAESGWSEDHLWPNVVRDFCRQQGWASLTAVFGTRVWHRGHEHILRSMLDSADALLLQPVSTDTKASAGLSESDALEAQQALIRNFFPRTRVLINQLSRHLNCDRNRLILQQAIVSQNYGCKHLVLVPAREAESSASPHQSLQALFDDARHHGLTISPQFLDAMFFCQSCDTVATHRSCPHDDAHHLSLDEAELIEMVLRGEALPAQAVRPEIARAISRSVSHHADPARLKRGANLFPHAPEVSRDTRELVAGHHAAVLWMTGLSGSGKSTIAHRLERELLMSGHRVFVLDGDTLRTGLCADLGFSREARQENIRRAGEVAKVMREAGLIVIASFISPFRAEREMLVEIMGKDFYEVFVDASLETCESRDPKGLYKRARAGVIPEFTGISSPYEPPANPAIHVQTDNVPVEECVQRVMRSMADIGLLRASGSELPHSTQLPVPHTRSQRIQ